MQKWVHDGRKGFLDIDRGIMETMRLDIDEGIMEMRR
jgi:hypothetical protein